MENIREKVIEFMEKNKYLTSFEGKKWYYMEDELTEFVKEMMNDKSLDFDYKWNLSTLEQLEEDSITQFTLSNGNKVEIERSNNGDNTYGYDIALFNKSGFITSWGLWNFEDLKSRFDEITQEICRAKSVD